MLQLDYSQRWPDLPYSEWRDTALTLQLWMQIVGKIRLALTPWLNHGWHVPLYVTARGLGTSPIPAGSELLEIDFDFIDHCLIGRTSMGERRALKLEPMSVADFRSRRHTVFRPERAPPSGRDTWAPQLGYAGGIFARGQQRGILAGQRCFSARRLLCLRLSRASRLSKQPRCCRIVLRYRHGGVHPAL